MAGWAQIEIHPLLAAHAECPALHPPNLKTTCVLSTFAISWLSAPRAAFLALAPGALLTTEVKTVCPKSPTGAVERACQWRWVRGELTGLRRTLFRARGVPAASRQPAAPLSPEAPACVRPVTVGCHIRPAVTQHHQCTC